MKAAVGRPKRYGLVEELDILCYENLIRKGQLGRIIVHIHTLFLHPRHELWYPNCQSKSLHHRMQHSISDEDDLLK